MMTTLTRQPTSPQDKKRYERHRAVVLAVVLFAATGINVIGIILLFLLAGRGAAVAWPALIVPASLIPLVAFYVLLRAMNSRQLGWDARIKLSEKASLKTELDVLKISLSMMGLILTGAYAIVSILWFVFVGFLARIAFTAGLGVAFLALLLFIGTVVFSWRYGAALLEPLSSWFKGSGVLRVAYAYRHPRR